MLFLFHGNWIQILPNTMIFLLTTLVSSMFVQLHEGVQKSGIMGFCDPCPGEDKALYVAYTHGGNRFEVGLFLLNLFILNHLVAD